MFIEPCCCHKQLPRLFKEASLHSYPIYAAGISMFQTNGDISFGRILDATSSLIEEQPFTLLLSTPRLNDAMLKHIEHYYRRGWIKSLLLLDSAVKPRDNYDLLSAPLRVHSRIIQHAPSSASPLFACIGRCQALVITGDFEQPKCITQHTAYLGSNADILKELLAPTISRFRIMEKGSNNIPDPRLDEIIAGHIFD